MIRSHLLTGTLTVLALTAALALLSGCHSSLDVDTSKGNYGKSSTTTTLPPQPDPQTVIKQQMNSIKSGKATPPAGVAPSRP